MFERLIRFESNGIEKLEGAPFPVVDGTVESGFRANSYPGRSSPLPHVPIFVCIGFNYHQHVNEANRTVIPYPVIFIKPAESLADARSMLDYEDELGVVIGCDAFNVSEDDALEYILGYTCANDVSVRNFQPSDASGGQYCFAKSFNKLAPSDLTRETRVNGSTRQSTSTSDMIWTVKQIIAHASKGTTLHAGTVILSGTPAGIGLFCTRQTLLKSGDEVEVYIDAIGTLRNKIVFE
ncbi:hypothetical protein BDV37DRAFT_270003 [Aspergillus pseudonomiae]|uniref:Fumarylacetoacetase-like C-terminal domain-containing protein n=1 Tax=Aspergillus pseudonomiae TaxID=1506151 RepID=A0A5N7DIY7_9EURO|nr:uncharacterized protein BDV37DRAFT_270003 [Aspergillus pseudonomiae]KAE8406397.1 hypothetical protein BDV37DRAFT_270003 [Aspergillus pseudonomiae]